MQIPKTIIGQSRLPGHALSQPGRALTTYGKLSIVDATCPARVRRRYGMTDTELKIFDYEKAEIGEDLGSY